MVPVEGLSSCERGFSDTLWHIASTRVKERREQVPYVDRFSMLADAKDGNQVEGCGPVSRTSRSTEDFCF